MLSLINQLMKMLINFLHHIGNSIDHTGNENEPNKTYIVTNKPNYDAVNENSYSNAL